MAVTVMLPVPLARLAVGVKTAVRVRPVPLMAPKEPPVTTRSPELPSHAKLVSGFSEKVKVMSAVSPILSLATLLAILTVGFSVSMLMLGERPELPVLPALSV